MTNIQNIKLRPATLDDVEALTALSYETIRVKYPSVIGADAVEGYIASGAVPAYYTDRVDYTRVAELDGEAVGACALMEDQIHLMMVTLEHHRSGIGALLLAEGESTLFQTYDRITLESFRDNAQAVHFYEKHGWRVIEHFDMPDYGIPMVRMEKLKA